MYLRRLRPLATIVYGLWLVITYRRVVEKIRAKIYPKNWDALGRERQDEEFWYVNPSQQYLGRYNTESLNSSGDRIATSLLSFDIYKISC